MIIEYQHSIGPGLTLVCEIEFSPGDPGNPNPESGTCCPPEPEQAFFCSATLHGVDVTDVLADHLKTYIQERALWSMLH